MRDSCAKKEQEEINQKFSEMVNETEKQLVESMKHFETQVTAINQNIRLLDNIRGKITRAKTNKSISSHMDTVTGIEEKILKDVSEEIIFRYPE